MAHAREYNREYMRKWRLAHPEHKELARNQHLALRKKVLTHYGHTCVCCGETTFEFLAMDHPKGGGNQHKKQRKRSGEDVDMTRWLIRNGFPEGYRVLCHNYNNARGFYGYCPHERENGKEQAA